MTTAGWQSHWHKHPGVRSGEELTRGKRAADKMRSLVGSWPLVFAFFGVMIAWAIVNSVFYLGGNNEKHGFDPYPYILLNLFLSMMAGVPSPSANRPRRHDDSVLAVGVKRMRCCVRSMRTVVPSIPTTNTEVQHVSRTLA